MGGNAVMFGTVLATFAQDMTRVPGQLRGYLEAGALSEAVRVLHTVKGLSATVGARHLAQVALALEQRVKAGAAPLQPAAIVQSLQEALDATQMALVPVLQRYAAPAMVQDTAQAASQPTALPTELQALSRMLEGSDMAALELYQRIRQDHVAARGQEFEAMDLAIAGLDFANAAVLCRSLAQSCAV
jgi:HPt (histidine-containing phosphotransfer) domain-containing protein